MRKKESPDTPDMPIQPPTAFCLTLATGWFLGYTANLPVVPERFHAILSLLGYLILAVSLVISFVAFLPHLRGKTNFRTDRPTKCVVTDGIFRFTRNPMYLSLFLVETALAFLFNNLWLLMGTVPFCLYVHYVVIPAEERYMENRFGETYRRYREKTPRWL